MKHLRMLLCIVAMFFCMVTVNLYGVTYTVTRTMPDDNLIGSLRWCMNMANGTPGFDTILFNIPFPGPQVIMPDSQLPILTDQAGVLIDGFSQGGSAGANPPSTANLMIVIDGTNAGPSHGIWIFSSNDTVQGLVVNNFQQDGIRIQARPDISQNNYIYCNFVGTDQTGTIDQGNGWNQQGLWAGIYVLCTPGTLGVAQYNTIQANLASGNYAEGVGIASCPPGDVAFNAVLDNYIGTDAGGAIDLGNDHDGVVICEGAHDNVVDNNLISGNDFEGVCIVGYAEAIPPVFTYANTVANNIIGLDVALAPLPNTFDGVSIGIYGAGLVPPWYQGGYATDNMISTNIIAHNGRNGVLVWEHFSNNANADFNPITQNSTYNNTLLGIDLADDGVTANDANDPDAGPNQEVNFPVITSAIETAGQTTISGNLDIDTSPDSALVEVFRVSPDPSGYGEGQNYLGNATPDAAGNWSVTVPGLVAGDTVTATTTDMNLNTSEFAQNVTVVTGIEEDDFTHIGSGFELYQNRPNPFVNSTSIIFSLSKNTRVNLCVYDVLGKVVKVLIDDLYGPSNYTIQWDGNDGAGRKVCPGVYFCVLETDDFTTVRKMIRAR